MCSFGFLENFPPLPLPNHPCRRSAKRAPARAAGCPAARRQWSRVPVHVRSCHQTHDCGEGAVVEEGGHMHCESKGQRARPKQPRLHGTPGTPKRPITMGCEGMVWCFFGREEVPGGLFGRLPNTLFLRKRRVGEPRRRGIATLFLLHTYKTTFTPFFGGRGETERENDEESGSRKSWVVFKSKATHFFLKELLSQQGAAVGEFPLPRGSDMRDLSSTRESRRFLQGLVGDVLQ